MVSKRLVLTLLVSVGSLLASLPAVATTTVLKSGVVHDYGNYIDLGQDTQAVTFTGTGSKNSVLLDFGSCTGGGGGFVTQSCTMTGVAKGYGIFAGKTNTYKITSPANIKLDLTNPSTGVWTAVTAGNSIDLYFGTNGSLLKGYLNQLQLQQIPKPISGNADWYLGTAQLTVTGGSLDHQTSKGMSVQFLFSNVTYKNAPSYINTLLGSSGKGHSISTTFGEGPIYSNPEPASVLLLGAGFLLAGAVVRYRSRRAATSKA